MSEPIYYRTLAELSGQLSRGEISSVEIAQAIIDRTRAVEGKVNAFLHRDETDLLAQAKTSDERRAKGQTRGPLDGLPIGIKDAIAVDGQPFTCASKMLEKFVSPYDATVVERLKNAGALIWGRLNLDELAMGSSTENSAFHTTSNPWNLDCIPGGSSGGSAAATAAGETLASLASDTGGSIRQPASHCGVVGLKPTYGLVSRYGLAAFASSLDQIGPITRSVEDAAMLLQAIAGPDRRDSTSLKVSIPDYRATLDAKRDRPLRLGLPKEYMGEGLSDDVRKVVDDAIAFYKSQGAGIVEVSLPHAALGLPVYYIIAPAEASSNLARLDGIRYTHRSEKSKDIDDIYFDSRAEGFGAEVKRRIILGTYVLSSGYYDAYYIRAQKVRSLIRDDFTRVFEKVDALISPVTPTPAFKRGEKTGNIIDMYLCDLYTIGVNLAGLPGISIPAGFSQAGLPVGLQLIGKPLAEAELLQTARIFERAHDCHTRRPSL